MSQEEGASDEGIIIVIFYLQNQSGSEAIGLHIEGIACHLTANCKLESRRKKNALFSIWDFSQGLEYGGSLSQGTDFSL